MATYNTPLITTQGLALLKAEIAGNDSVTFTKIVFSSDDYSQTADSAVQALTGLSNLDLTAPAKSFTDVNGNLKIRAVGNNENTSSAFYIKTYGLYGTNKAGNELLIAVATTQNANFVPAYNGKQTNQIAYTFNIAISSTNNITLSSSTDVGVTQADLAGINNYVNSNANSASSAIASNASIINSVQSSVTANSSAIASNASSISNLQSTVSSNSSAIANNTNSINNLSSNGLAYKGTMHDNDDFNNYTTTGIYHNWAYNNLQNSPVSGPYWGVLAVYAGPNGTTQTVTSYIGYWFRYRSGGAWGAWQQLATENDVNQINANMQYLSNRTGAIEQYYFHNQRQLSNTDDLNTILVSGTYTINNAMPQNMPSDEVAGFNSGKEYLYNDYLFIVFSDGSNTQQELINSSLGTHYIRGLASMGSSNTWQKLVTEDELQNNSNPFWRVYTNQLSASTSIDDLTKLPSGKYEIVNGTGSASPSYSSNTGSFDVTNFSQYDSYIIFTDLYHQDISVITKSYYGWSSWKKLGGVTPNIALNSVFRYHIDNGDMGSQNPYVLFRANLKANHVYWIGIDSNQTIMVSYDGNINNALPAWNQSTFTNSGGDCYAVFGLRTNGDTKFSNFRIYDVTELKAQKESQNDLDKFM